jgi:outer membrane receptor for ferrienterochelin and colicin
MAQSSNRKTWLRLGAGVSLLTLSSAFGLAAPALAQQQPAAEGTGDVVVVTGFRGSLAAAIEVKREENGIVDVITAEDIADFPDLNLAESLQRVPGVQIDRDGGEGRTINVRGLSSDFVRVRLNGLEALATRTATARSISTCSLPNCSTRSRCRSRSPPKPKKARSAPRWT